MGDYRFTFEGADATLSSPVPTSPNATDVPMPSVLPESPNMPSVSEGSALSVGADRFTKSAISQLALSPLNQATGNMATPVYNIGKAAFGGNVAALSGAVGAMAFQGVMLAVQKVQERVAKMEAKAAEMNERDNMLIRAGAVSKATFYEGKFGGVKTIERS